jgi:hypothetical protein
MDKFYLFRSTTDRLTGHLEHIEESGDTVLGMAFLGGEKHWIIVCRRGRLVPEHPLVETSTSAEPPHPPGLRRVGAVPREQSVLA